MHPGACAASSSKRAVAAASDGVDAPFGGTVPSRRAANSSRPSAELRLSHDPAHHTTAWCCARVSATYASRRSSPTLLGLVLAAVVGEVDAAHADVDDAARRRATGRGRRSAAGRAGCSPAPTGTGTITIGNSRPLLRWMVSTWTASASDSRRRLRSSSVVSSPASAICRRSHAVSAVTPACSAIAASCSSWATWRRSVRRRSPSWVRSTRSGSPSDERDRLGAARRPRGSAAAAPRRAAGGAAPRAPPRRRTPGPARSSRGTGSAPRRAPAARRTGARAPRAAAASRAPGVVPKTLPAPLMTAGMPASSSASRTSAALRCVRTSTATWPGRTRSRRDRLARVVADLDLRLGREEPGEVGREVLGDVLARRRVADDAAARALQPRVVAVDDADAQRRALGRAGQPRRRGWPAPPRRAGRRCPRARAARRRRARRRRRAGPGRCAS